MISASSSPRDKPIIMRLHMGSSLCAFIGILVASCNGSSPLPPDDTEFRLFQAAPQLLNLQPRLLLGRADVLVSRDSLDVFAGVGPLPSNVSFRMGIAAGMHCPATEADVNGDGFVDGVELRQFFVGLLIPFDGDLSSQLAGWTADNLPKSNEEGVFRFEQAAPKPSIVLDLAAEDPDPEDILVKLGTDSLAVGDRTFIILGVSDTTTLPPSVSALPGLTPQESLPVVCGEFEPKPLID